jgi:hypothetical protein
MVYGIALEVIRTVTPPRTPLNHVHLSLTRTESTIHQHIRPPRTYTIMATAAENPEAFPLQGLTSDGWSNEEEASATCACGAVQMVIVSRASLPPSTRHSVCQSIQISDLIDLILSLMETRHATHDSH